LVSVIFVLGVLNLVMGFALAVVLERPTVIYVPRVRPPRQKNSDTDTATPVISPALDEGVEQLPAPPADVRMEHNAR
jgi:hypothetical protein